MRHNRNWAEMVLLVAMIVVVSVGLALVVGGWVQDDPTNAIVTLMILFIALGVVGVLGYDKQQ